MDLHDCLHFKTNRSMFFLVAKEFCLAISLNLIKRCELAREDVVNSTLAGDVLYLTT